MILSDMKQGMIVYIRDYSTVPPTTYECIVVGWTERLAKLELTHNNAPLSRAFGELSKELPANVVETEAGIYKEEPPRRAIKKEQRPKWPNDS